MPGRIPVDIHENIRDLVLPFVRIDQQGIQVQVFGLILLDDNDRRCIHQLRQGFVICIEFGTVSDYFRKGVKEAGVGPLPIPDRDVIHIEERIVHQEIQPFKNGFQQLFRLTAKVFNDLICEGKLGVRELVPDGSKPVKGLLGFGFRTLIA